MDDTIFLPTMSHWQFGNSWSGTFGRACFWVTPEEGSLNAEVWTGPRCREGGEAEHTARFPMEESGLEALRVWLEERSAEINRAEAPFRYHW